MNYNRLLKCAKIRGNASVNSLMKDQTFSCKQLLNNSNQNLYSLLISTFIMDAIIKY
jgi:hypothetical protein